LGIRKHHAEAQSTRRYSKNATWQVAFPTSSAPLRDTPSLTFGLTLRPQLGRHVAQGRVGQHERAAH
jgi:hypothetical protein